ncbi:hypothetical protein [Chitinophaga qingshengii]|uniref:Uncharacterized protein n=1 Tax=Chitinophaga qingshengii TaxID=1569794 RepID=A0ABR7THB5_9BACT|nr:hypothetical protein [Chitinophaga qingshengii]MBC9929885.1 hypothetical protein [Chitinophaga qingshengii]
MKKYFIYLLPLCATFACADNHNQQGKTDTTTATVHNVSAAPGANAKPGVDTDAVPAWADSLIIAFSQETSNELIRFAAKEKTLEWMLDGTEETDSATYMVFHLGHHMEEPDHTDPRFATDGWVYINTRTRKLYEYDVAADNLIPWHKK